MSSEWQSAALGSLCAAVFSGGTPTSTNAEYFDGSIPWLRTKEVNYTKIDSTELYISQAGYENSSAKLVPKNSVIVAMYGNGDTAGRVAINKIPLTTNQACCNLVVDAGRADYRFVYYVLKARYQELVDLKNGGAQQNLNARLIKAFPIAVPLLPEQRKIADLFECLDDRIALLQETNATLEAIAQALFKSWFVDFDPVRAKQQGLAPAGMDADTAALFPDRLTQSPSTIIPSGWIEGTVEDLLDLAYGKALKAADRKIGDVPVYGSGGLTGFHDSPFVEAPCVIVGRKGTVGSVYWVDKPCCPIDTVFYVRPKVPLSVCFYQLQRMGLDGMNTDAAVPGLNRNNVYRLAVVTAPIAVYVAFDEVARALRAKRSMNDGLIETLITLRDTLLPRLISGQLQIPEAEARIAEAVA